MLMPYALSPCHLPSSPCLRGALLLVVTLLGAACGRKSGIDQVVPAAAMVAGPAVFWNSATIYFLLTDRFFNGDSTNDRAAGRTNDGAMLRNFEGGDLAGVLQKIEEGYFDSLG